MKSKSFDTGWALLALAFLALLIMLPGLAAYGEGDQARSVTLTPLSIAATAVAGITLVPYTRTGFSSVVPDGWAEKNSGEFWRGSPEADPTVLVQQDVPGATTDMVLELLRPKLGLEKLPKSVGVIKNKLLSWDLYAIEREDPDTGKMAGDIAIAQDDHGVYIVLLGTKPDEYEDLHYGVFLRAVDALTPVAAKETEKDAEQPQKAVGTVGAEVLLVKGERLDNDASDAVADILREGLGLSTAFVDLRALGEADFEGVKLISDHETDQSPLIVADVPTEGVANRFFSVSATGSHDPHDYPVGFIWDFGDGSPKQYRPEAIHIYASAGTYTLKLTVTTGTRHSTQSTKVTIGEP